MAIWITVVWKLQGKEICLEKVSALIQGSLTKRICPIYFFDWTKSQTNWCYKIKTKIWESVKSMQSVAIKTQILYGFGPTENETGSRKA